MNVDFPSFLFAFGIEAANDEFFSHSLNPDRVGIEEGTGFIDPSRRVETDAEEGAISWIGEPLGE